MIRDREVSFRNGARRSMGVFLFLFVLYGVPSLAQDWPQWRGPKRAGVAGAGPEVAWDKTPQQAWSIEVGEGHAAPVVQDGRIWLHSRVDDRETVFCLDLEQGTVLWRQAYDAPYQMDPNATGHGPGPKSTPVLHQGRLFTLGISGILSAWDADEGTLLWRRGFTDEFETTSPLFGTAASPLASGDMVYAQIGGHDRGAVRAFGVADGQTRWSWEGDGPGYASPILIEVDGVRQLVMQTQRHFVGLEAAGGTQLWKAEYTTPHYQNSVTPVQAGDLLLVSGLDQGLLALRPVRDEAGWKVETAWSTREVSLYMSTPVLSGGVLYGLSHFKNGQYFGLDPHSGQVRWVSPGRQGEHASLLSSGGVVVALDTAGDLLVFGSDGTGFEPAARHRLAATPTWAHPAPLADGLLVKDKFTLARWRFAP